MKKLSSRYGYVFTAYRARKARRCDTSRFGCPRRIEAGEGYARIVMFPGDVVDHLSVASCCRHCLDEEHRIELDAALNHEKEG